jgi:hypothetical protein
MHCCAHWTIWWVIGRNEEIHVLGLDATSVLHVPAQFETGVVDLPSKESSASTRYSIRGSSRTVH